MGLDPNACGPAARAAYEAQIAAEQGRRATQRSVAPQERAVRGTPEEDMQIALFAEAERHWDEWPELAWMHAIPNGGGRDKRTAGRMKAQGVRKGVLDILLPVRRYTFIVPDNGIGYSKVYAGFYIELKYGRNKPSAEQRAFMAFVEGQGYRVGVYWSWEDAWAALVEYLRLPR